MLLADLRYIVALACERHFGRAAEKCQVSQRSMPDGRESQSRVSGGSAPAVSAAYAVPVFVGVPRLPVAAAGFFAPPFAARGSNSKPTLPSLPRTR